MSHSTSTPNYNLPQFAASDKPAWLTDINGAFSDIDTGMHNNAVKAAAAVTNFAPAFSSDSTYDEGDYVTYNNGLYVCIAAVTAPGPWNPNNWDAQTVADIAASAGVSDYDDLTDKPSVNGVTLSGNKTTSDLGIVPGTLWEPLSDELIESVNANISIWRRDISKAVIGTRSFYMVDIAFNLTGGIPASSDIPIISIDEISQTTHFPVMASYTWTSNGTTRYSAMTLFIRDGKLYLPSSGTSYKEGTGFRCVAICEKGN